MFQYALKMVPEPYNCYGPVRIIQIDDSGGGRGGRRAPRKKKRRRYRNSNRANASANTLGMSMHDPFASFADVAGLEVPAFDARDANTDEGISDTLMRSAVTDHLHTHDNMVDQYGSVLGSQYFHAHRLQARGINPDVVDPWEEFLHGQFPEIYANESERNERADTILEESINPRRRKRGRMPTGMNDNIFHEFGLGHERGWDYQPTTIEEIFEEDDRPTTLGSIPHLSTIEEGPGLTMHDLEVS